MEMWWEQTIASFFFAQNINWSNSNQEMPWAKIHDKT